MKRLLLFACLALTALSASGATNDLVITSIAKQGSCVTLQWRSHPGEFYTVFWTDNLNTPIFWRVAEVNVSSGGTNTIWSEGDCSQQMMMAGPGSGGGGTALSAEQKSALMEKYKDYVTPDYLYPPGHPKAPKSVSKTNVSATSITASVSAEAAEGAVLLEDGAGGGQMALLSGGGSGGAKFYRVARTGVSGFIDGWGGTLGATPATLEGLGNAFAVSASPRDSGAHSLALLTNGAVTAWGVILSG